MSRVNKAIEYINQKGWRILSISDAALPVFSLQCEHQHIFNINLVSIKKDAACKVCKELKRFSQKIVGQDCKLDSLTVLENSNVVTRCAKGHVFEWPLKKVLPRTMLCPICKKQEKNKIKRKEYAALAVPYDGALISEWVTDTNQIYLWRCKEGHEFSSRPKDIKDRGRWCPTCKKKEAGKDIKAQLQSVVLGHQGSVEEIEPIVSTRMKARFSCKKGHSWVMTIGKVLSGTWCRSCKRTIYSLDDFKTIAKKHKGNLLTEKYINAHQKISFKCHQGHEFNVMASSALKGAWCPNCRKEKDSQAIRQRVLDIVKANQGRCIGLDEVKGRRDYINLECNEGHTWRTLVCVTLRGSWCKWCSQRKNK